MRTKTVKIMFCRYASDRDIKKCMKLIESHVAVNRVIEVKK